MEFDVATRIVTVLVKTGNTIVLDMDYDYENRYVYFPRYTIYDIVRYVNNYELNKITKRHFE